MWKLLARLRTTLAAAASAVTGEMALPVDDGPTGEWNSRASWTAKGPATASTATTATPAHAALRRRLAGHRRARRRR